MPLTPGTRLGPYEIVSPLGAGGMGEVYRANDTRLGREVAVKVLPEHLSSNPEIRTRFEREARAVSSLNHPHICTLHDVGREGGTDYLVMELVEGETLAQRLERGALPVGEVIRLGSQIADALDRAHRAGVVHRDLKPGNVMLTRAGAKLMDFGLARASTMGGPVSGSGATLGALTQSPTVVSPLTVEGSLVGTFQYMSPEQLEGKEADARSDIWALGCVLYEMASGRRAFDGRSQASLISAIMGQEPLPVSQVAPMAPAGLDRLVRTCLTKDPEERMRTAHDVKLQLEGIAEGNSQVGAAAFPPGRAARPRKLAWAVAALAALVALVLGAVLVMQSSRPQPPIQVSINSPRGVQLGPYSSLISVSPDGAAVAYCASDSGKTFAMWVQRLDAPGPTRLASMPSPAFPIWSPDSRNIGILGFGEGGLATVPATGGNPVKLCDGRASRGATWNRDGVILFAPSPQSALFRISVNGGEPVQASWPDSLRHESAHRFPCFLPDGKHFLYASLPRGPKGIGIYAGELGSRQVKRIFFAESAPTYVAPGYLIFRRSGKVIAQRFNADALQLKGDPVAIADAPPLSALDAEPIASASGNGRLVFLESPSVSSKLEWMDRTGTVRSTIALPEGKWERAALSPDDRFAVVLNGDDLWRVDLGRSVASRLTSNGASNDNPVWSPDGTRIAFRMRRTGREEIQIMNSDGSGAATTLTTTDDLFKNPECWTRDGLFFMDLGEKTFQDIWVHPLQPGGRPRPLIQTAFTENQSAVSPDGRWMAYLSNEAGQLDVYVSSYPSLGHKVRISSGGAWRAWWMPGSDEIIYRSFGRTEMWGVKLTRRGEDLEVGTPRLLFSIPAGVNGMDMSHDGQRWLVISSGASERDNSLRVILNWTGMLKR